MDVGKLGAKVAGYLNEKLGGELFAEVELKEFFPLGGVAIENDVIQFPESKFYACTKSNLVILKTTPPSHEWYKFLNLVLDTAEKSGTVKEIYTVGGMVSYSAHTAPRQLQGVFNSMEFREDMRQYDVDCGMNYETPAGQKPTLSSFLLWTAQKRNIPAMSLWVTSPFYLVAVDDLMGQRKVLDFINRRFTLGLDLVDIDNEIKKQSQKLADMRRNSPDIDLSIQKLENGLGISEEESQNLVTEMRTLFKSI
ncbi:MAG: PAC2 family protein [Methanobacteriota archaeon]